MTKTLVLLNPHAAGGKAAALAEPLRAWLTQYAPLVVLEIPASVVQARSLVDALPPSSRVVVVGGDGTLNQLLPSLLNGAHTLALVPFGSGNDTARALGLYGLSWEKALAHGLAGAARQIEWLADWLRIRQRQPRVLLFQASPRVLIHLWGCAPSMAPSGCVVCRAICWQLFWNW